MTDTGDEANAALTELVLLVFRLNGDFLAAAETIAVPAGLTAARWQVLGAVLDEPRTVAGIARKMGLARQSVQRLADLLVAADLATYVDNAAHRRAKLLKPTAAGLAAVKRLGARQRRWAKSIAEGLCLERLNTCKAVITELIERVEIHAVEGTVVDL
jgi:DNA-binding MarR family transcriptional regulator